jgi:AcrR family transcriptional regulator
MDQSSTYHHRDLPKTLLESALAELRERGPAALSLRRIAARAGVSHAAPYRHFRDKDELLAAIAWDTQEAFTAALRSARERTDGPPKERLFGIGTAYLEFARSNPERMGLMFSEAGINAMARYPVEQTREAMIRYDSFGVLETTVRECQADGTLDDTGDSGAISILVWSIVHGLSVIEREGFLASLGAQRGLAPETTHRLVLDAFRTLVSRNARPSR